MKRSLDVLMEYDNGSYTFAHVFEHGSHITIFHAWLDTDKDGKPYIKSEPVGDYDLKTRCYEPYGNDSKYGYGWFEQFRGDMWDIRDILSTDRFLEPQEKCVCSYEQTAEEAYRCATYMQAEALRLKDCLDGYTSMAESVTNGLLEMAHTLHEKAESEEVEK